MADSTEYVEKLYEIEDIPPNDELVAGAIRDNDIYAIRLSTAGEYKRGMLLMQSSEGFIPATKSGATSGVELCILGMDATIDEGYYLNTFAYFSGTFKGSAIILPYEEESDNHDELLSELSETFRKQRILVK